MQEGCKYGYECYFSHHQKEACAGLNNSCSDNSQVHLKGRVPFYVPIGYQSSDIFTVPVGPTGLPIRTDRPVCIYYSQFGLCKYGVGCPDDHPVDFKGVAAPLPSSNSSKHNRSHK